MERLEPGAMWLAVESKPNVKKNLKHYAAKRHKLRQLYPQYMSGTIVPLTVAVNFYSRVHKFSKKL
jgi:hypothetical protein